MGDVNIFTMRKTEGTGACQMPSWFAFFKEVRSVEPGIKQLTVDFNISYQLEFQHEFGRPPS